MSSLYCMMTITDRKRLTDFMHVYRETGLDLNQITLGHGTAPDDALIHAGLDGSEKAVTLTVVTGEKWREMKQRLRRELRIDVPGTGISFIIPMSSITGKRVLDMFTEGMHFERGEESAMTGTNHQLLIVISNQGYNELVMDAAREQGAGGGTVIHARGTGTEKSERFLGISLASEKDLIFIVTPTGKKNAIMNAIVEKAGPGTRAGAVVFSLPVTDTAGMRLTEEAEEEDTPAEA